LIYGSQSNHILAKYQINIPRKCIGCKYMSPMFTVLKEKELDLIDQNKYTVAFKKGEIIRTAKHRSDSDWLLYVPGTTQRRSRWLLRIRRKG
jgi:hypothetical protein